MSEAKKKPSTSAKKRLFLEAYAQLGNISGAAKLAEMHRSVHYAWLDTDPKYAKAFADAESQYADKVRMLVNKLAQGYKDDVWYQGRIVGSKTLVSERMLELLAKAKCPEFREKHEITGANGEAVKIQVVTGVPQPEEM